MAKNKSKNSFSGSKLYDLLKKFNRQEYSQFGVYLQSPFFNKSNKMLEIFNFLKPYHKKNILETVRIEELHRALYGNVKLNGMLIRKQLSDFLKHTIKFIIQIEFESDRIRKLNLLLESANKRKVKNIFSSTIKELDELYKNSPEKNTYYYEHMLNTKRLKYEHEASMLQSPEKNINDLSFGLDMFYLSLKLLYYYDILNLRLHYNKKVEFDMWAFDDISKFIEANSKKLINEHSAIYADYLSVLMLQHPAESSYFKNLKDFVFNNSIKLGITALHKLYIILYNHSVYRHNRGFAETPAELFDIIKIIDNENIPIWNYFAFHIYYVNAVTNAVRQGEFIWAERFINERKSLIREDIREETNSLALANLYFTKHDYNNALKYLVNVDYPNYSYYLMAKDMMIKIYWERSETEGVYSAIDAMRKFLQRKDLIPERLHESYTNFINCVNLMTDKGKKDLRYEINRLLEKEMISADKVWVKAKLDELGV